MSSDDELRRATVFLERLLEDPQLRADFRRRPAKTCRAFELDGLADELDSGERGTATLELRESRSGLAGVMIGVAAEGLGLAELLARHASDLGNASASDLIARLGGGPDNAQAASPAAAPAAPAGSAEAAPTAVGAALPADPNAVAAAPPATGAPAAGLPATAQPAGAEAAAGLPAAYPPATAQAAAAPAAAAPPAGLPAAAPPAAAEPAAGAPATAQPAAPPATAEPTATQPAAAPPATAESAAAPPATGQAVTEPATESPTTAQPSAPPASGLPATAQPAGTPASGLPATADPSAAPPPASAQPAAPAPTAAPPVTAAALAADARAIDPNTVVESSGQRAIELAKQHLGESYVWGGASPQTGFDCSGLVQYVYSQVGVQLPRVTQDQIGVGQHIGLSDLRTGDMVFFRDPSGDVHHVGLYLDHGRFLHAPHTGDVIKISSLDEPYYASQFTGGRRVGEVAAAVHDVDVIRRSAGEIAARANDARVMPVLDPSAPRPRR